MTVLERPGNDNKRSHRYEENEISGTVVDGRGAALTYRGFGITGKGFQVGERETELEFLCERYSAFTQWGVRKRVFRILHDPWRVLPLATKWLDTDLLINDFEWFKDVQHTGSYWTPGARNVLISRPRRIE